MSSNIFENIALKYAETVDQKAIHVYYERPNLLSLLPDPINNLKVLDLGFGSGWYAEYLASKGAHVTAIDNSATMVQLTKNRVKTASVMLADLNKPLGSLADKSFDMIVAPLTIHYIQDWNFLFKELAKKLKNKGLFIFSIPNPYAVYSLFNLENYFKTLKVTDEWDNIGKVDFYHHTFHDLAAALLEAGFIIEQLLEPPALAEMQNVEPKMYANIATKPWFLFVKVIKDKDAR